MNSDLIPDKLKFNCRHDDNTWILMSYLDDKLCFICLLMHELCLPPRAAVTYFPHGVV